MGLRGGDRPGGKVLASDVERSEITPALVSRLVATQFPGWADLRVTPVELNGNDNVTFRLGDELSVRLPSADRYVLELEKEHRWLPFLAGHLPLPIPEPVAKGVPGFGYPWPWSVYRWLRGAPATVAPIANEVEFATALAAFLAAMYRIDPTGGPAPGPHNFFRGGSPATYDAEARDAIAALKAEINTDAATELWEATLAATWRGSPVWIHGDVSADNLLVEHGQLSAVIDFGSSAVGDPACDVTIAWTFFAGESREAFRTHLPVDASTWTRGQGWALWKALITLVDARTSNAGRAARCRRIIEEVIAERMLAT